MPTKEELIAQREDLRNQIEELEQEEEQLEREEKEQRVQELEDEISDLREVGDQLRDLINAAYNVDAHRIDNTLFRESLTDMATRADDVEAEIQSKIEDLELEQSEVRCS
jgi:chromosome segregation ATPase